MWVGGSTLAKGARVDAMDGMRASVMRCKEPRKNQGAEWGTQKRMSGTERADRREALVRGNTSRPRDELGRNRTRGE